MKIGIFTDAHYSSQKVTCGSRYNSLSLKKISEACRYFVREKCDLVVCLGDLTDTEDTHEKEAENLREIAKLLRETPVKTVCLMGNHDAFAFEEEEFYSILDGCRPEDLTENGRTLLFLDACWYKSGQRYAPGGTDWTDTFYPHTQALKEKLACAAGDIYISLHQNLDPAVREDHRLYNAQEINSLLQADGRVRAVYQGHFHPGSSTVSGGIRYKTFPAMCENEGAYFIEEL